MTRLGALLFDLKYMFKEHKNIAVLKETTSIKNVADAIYNDQVKKAFFDFVRQCKEPYVVIGGLAMGVYVQPRSTQDIDILVSSPSKEEEIAKELTSFKHHRKLSVEHKRTGVEVEILNPQAISISSAIMVYMNMTILIQEVDGTRVAIASPLALVLLKLPRAINKGFKSMMDRSDIQALIEAQGPFDLSAFNLPEEQMKLYNELVSNL